MEEFRQLALDLIGSQESEHCGHPDFRVGKKIFASLRRQCGMVKVDAATQHDLLSQYPEVFQPEAGAWGRQGCTRVQLDRAEREVVAQALQAAWRLARG